MNFFIKLLLLQCVWASVGAISNTKINFIILYYSDHGFSPLFQLFLVTTGYNLDMDFTIVSNLNELPTSSWLKTSNVHLKTLSYDELNTRIFAKLNRDISKPITAKTAYKLVDFKPMFGYLFPDLIKNYDFWGHIDQDTILSKLRCNEFISDDLLNNNDIISATNSMCNGPLQIYRNTEYINQLYSESKDLPFVINATMNTGFTESHGIMKIPFPVAIRRAYIKERLNWNHTLNSFLEDRYYFRRGAEPKMVWSPKYRLRLRWNSTGFYEEELPIGAGMNLGFDEQPDVKGQVIGFFHLISWKYLQGYKNLDETTLQLIKEFIKNPSIDNDITILISCHGILAGRKGEELNLLESSTAAKCSFSKDNAHFYRIGKKPACLGGPDGYENMHRFRSMNKKDGKKKRKRKRKNDD